MKKESTSRARQFVRRSMLGGIVVLLPVAIIAFFFKWIYQSVTSMIAPITAVLISGYGMPKFLADWIVVAVLVMFCFLVGHIVSTRFGNWLWERVENGIMTRLPGYRTVREVIAQLVGGSEESPFARGEVARVWLYGKQVDVSVTALVTAWHVDGRVTVFVPTGPNPTSGFIYHVAADLVETYPDVRVEQMMKSVIACGAGSGRLFEGQERRPPFNPRALDVEQ